MYFRKIKHQLTEVYINDPIESDSEGNALTIADIISSGVNVENDVELKINSEKLYKFIDEELDDREREIICKRYGATDRDNRVDKPNRNGYFQQKSLSQFVEITENLACLLTVLI